jgi:SAM-dependent methyltransferase
MDDRQQQIDKANSEFWNELCGTGLATMLGITDSSKESLAKFDHWYLAYYPYLLPIVQPERMGGKSVLEIGLGYGTLGQKIAETGARYTGMDLARKPVDHMNWRLGLHGVPGKAVQGSALQMPFPDASFDFLVSIGCFHHTGNVQRCFDETYRVLRPGGTAVLMVYNKFSFRQWQSWPRDTFREMLRNMGLIGARRELSAQQRAQYDANAAGAAAPETVLLSAGEIKRMLRAFESVRCMKQNADHLLRKGQVLVTREKLLGNLGRLLGLDIYIEARKASAVVRRAA